MKTFAEAIQVAIPSIEIKPEQSLQGALEKSASLHETLARYQCLINEARQSPHYRFMSNHLCEAVKTRMMTPRDALLSAFASGLVTGVEMERNDLADLEGIRLEPTPAAPPAAAAASNTQLYVQPMPFAQHGPAGPAVEATVPIGEWDDAPAGQYTAEIAFLDSQDGMLMLVRAETATETGEYFKLGNPVVRVGFELSPDVCHHIKTAMDKIAARKGWSI